MAIKAKLLPRWPSAITGTAPIVAAKANGAVALSYDSSTLPQVSSPTGAGRVVVREGTVYNEVPALNIAFPAIANNTLVGNNSGGTAAPSALTAAQAAALLPAMVGDTGSGGTKGLVPAPASGDAVAGRFLKADGTFAVPSGAVSSVAGRTGAVTLDGTDVSFTQSGTGATTRNATLKMRDEVNINDFGAAGDGVTNDTTPLINFFNSAISRPGVRHVLNANTYIISSVMPTINVSNVWIEGQGAEIHDVGTLMAGTVLKWGGAPTVGYIIDIVPVTGASAQRLAYVVFKGIGIDCNSGAVEYAMRVQSVFSAEIDVAIANAKYRALALGVTSPLGEAGDLQKSNIRLSSRNIEAPDGIGLSMSGNAVANVSMNSLWLDIVHKNAPAIYLQNDDNNDFWFVRTYKVPGGTATDSVSCVGSNVSADETSRYERFHQFSTNLPLQAYGTGSYTYAAGPITMYSLDTGNGTPSPVAGTGANVYFQKDTTNLLDNPWVSYTPVVTSSSGSITTKSATGVYARRGTFILVRIEITITTNGTGAGVLNVTAPITSSGTIGSIFVGKERAVTGNQVTAFLDSSSTTIGIQKYDGTYPGVNGAVITITGFYPV